ncbi:MAG TPA: glycosyltransferase family 1 protein [Thermoanaerobaculia bacterium]|nr:glycosyltransferase family 1 protein [Thermoanaerobaculia bacterium]
MKVGIDARALLSEHTGIAVYTAQIARGLSALPGVDVTLFAPREISLSAGSLPSSFRPGSNRRRFGTVWLQTRLSRDLAAEGCDVLLSAVTIAPARIDLPYVPVVHDLTPLTHPEWHRRKTIVAFLPWIEKTLERSARVIAVSQATAAELARRFPDVAARIAVIEHGVDSRFSPVAAEPGEADSVRAARTAGRPFILHLGTFEPRKNLGTLVAACERLWSEDPRRPDLLLAGSGGWKSEALLARIARSPFAERIHRAGYVPAEDVPALLRSAEAFCYPSREEGFGLPVLEAMASGTPAVISNAAALLEVARDAALAVAPDDVAGFAGALARFLDDRDLRRTQIERGLARAAGFRWPAAAERTARVLRDAAESAGGRGER